MKWLKRILLAIVVLGFVLVGIGLMLPAERHLERSVVVDASPSELFQYANDFRQFNRWSPWASIDPEGTSYEFSGPPAGLGSQMRWSSEHRNVGSGTQKITQSEPFDKVQSELRFDGFEKPAYATFTFEPTAGGTRVTWSFDAEMDGLVGRYMGLMIEKWVGADYERGLSNLKQLVE